MIHHQPVHTYGVTAHADAIRGPYAAQLSVDVRHLLTVPLAPPAAALRRACHLPETIRAGGYESAERGRFHIEDLPAGGNEAACEPALGRETLSRTQPS
jgi:hypothetical protein